MKTILVDAVYVFVDKEGNIDAGLHKLLETYPNRKILLTGADDVQFKTWKLDTMPYEVFTLKHNTEKSDPAYYQKMLEYFGLSANDVVYFEHSPDAVKSAESVGITTFLFDHETRDMSALKNFLDTNLG